MGFCASASASVSIASVNQAINYTPLNINKVSNFGNHSIYVVLTGVIQLCTKTSKISNENLQLLCTILQFYIVLSEATQMGL